MSVAEGQYFEIRVRAPRLNLTLTLKAPDGQTLVEALSVGAAEAYPIWIAQASGTYTLEAALWGRNMSGGTYELRMPEPRATQPGDRERVRAQSLRLESRRLLLHPEREGLAQAREKCHEGLAIARELADPELPASPAPVTTEPSPVPGDSTDVPAHPFAPPIDLIRPSPAPMVSDFERLQSRFLLFPVEGFELKTLRDDFAEKRGDRVHEAIDFPAPRGTPVVAVDDGEILKLFNSVRGGLTIYHFDPSGSYCYYYAHLDRYAEGLAERQRVRKGQRLGYVGTSGNAPPDVPHLHFTIFKLGPEKNWWEGTPVDPFPLWALAPRKASK